MRGVVKEGVGEREDVEEGDADDGYEEDGEREATLICGEGESECETPCALDGDCGNDGGCIVMSR